MSPIAKKMFGAATAFMLAVLEAALIIGSAIGLTTSGDDAAAKLPVFVVWLMATQWWVPAFVIPALLLAVMTWTFWPDLSVSRAMKEYKAANDRAWTFEPEFRDAMAKLDALQERFDQREAELQTALRDQRREFEERANALHAVHDEVRREVINAKATIVETVNNENRKSAEALFAQAIADLLPKLQSYIDTDISYRISKGRFDPTSTTQRKSSQGTET